MARKAKRKKKTKAAKSKRRGVKRARKGAKSAKRRAAGTKAKTGRRKTVSRTTKAARKQKEPIPSEPAGRVGLKRPTNRPKPPGPNEPRELAQAEPDARFDDQRQPEENARDPEAAAEETGRDTNYKNTDERF